MRSKASRLAARRSNVRLSTKLRRGLATQTTNEFQADNSPVQAAHHVSGHPESTLPVSTRPSNGTRPWERGGL